MKERTEGARTNRAISTISNFHELPYVTLPLEFTQDLCWSDDLHDLALQTYFNPDGPNLGRDFKVEGLQPVLREKRGQHRFILDDKKGRFYMYEEWDGQLRWVKSQKIEEFQHDQDKVDWILCELGFLETEDVYRDYHPADSQQIGKAEVPKSK